MRIIRGRFKTRKYPVPKQFPSRPTTDFAKEGLFNVLEHQFTLFDLSILDLCAGTGSISFEFLSREAGFVTSVDKHHRCVGHLKSMARTFECQDEIEILRSDILKFLEKTEEQYDIIFADPPYAYKEHRKIAEIVFERELLHPGGMLIIEHGKETSLEDITQFDFLRTYGGVHFSFFQLNSDHE